MLKKGRKSLTESALLCIMIMERTQNDEKTSEFTVLIRKYYFYGGFVMKFRLTAIALVLCLLILSLCIISCGAPNNQAPNDIDSDACEIETPDVPEANNASDKVLPVISASAPYNETGYENVYVTLEKASYTATEEIRITVGNKSSKPFSLCKVPIIQKLNTSTGEWTAVEERDTVQSILTTVTSQSTVIYFNPKSISEPLTAGTYRFIICFPNHYIVSPEFTLTEE